MRTISNVFLYELLGIIWIFLAAIPRRLIFPLHGLFAFNYDQGRDFLAVSKIIWEKDLVLIGQTTGLPGIFYGPWWYYFLAPVVFVSGGDPQGVAVFFAFLSILSIVALYLLLKALTNNIIISLMLATIASFSNLSMIGPPSIWNPSLTPIFLMISIYAVHKIVKNLNPYLFFIYGISIFLAIDTTASFGALLFILFVISPFIFKKVFFKKQYLFAVIGAFIVLLPRILFELRNNFLITKAVIAYLMEPRIYGDRLTLFERVLARLGQMLRIFAEGFTNENKALAILFIALILCVFLILLKINKKMFSSLKKDFMFLYLFSFLSATIIFFIIFPDNVWDYYLIALPTLFILIIARILSHGYQLKILKLPIVGVLLVLIFLNFRTDYIPPFHITWEGDGGTYINEKKVMDYIASNNPHDFSFFAYSPAIFDYPFDYLILWYSKRGLIEAPKENQQIMYLVIREASTRKYYSSGWYGDKIRDQTEVVDKKEFPGDLLVEKHKSLD